MIVGVNKNDNRVKGELNKDEKKWDEIDEVEFGEDERVVRR